ncbi:hypothetical protein GGQ88_003485 [Novosphingobium hassiacum]|uniref:Uncharacterized protein n=1 Tax=Novosphingobium hassiacum TaxID=173676 RepID=A0A7W6EXA1_9SPHN|nr:DUF4286 family protein [Novosphingobium hassiacum]MBB3862187.1 hypothetical protein [Novosphingobium hassiacum]
MPRFKMMVLSNPVGDRDEEFNRWYDEVHLGDVFKVPGVIGAERYRFRSGNDWKYLAIYELDCEDPAAVEQELLARAGSDAMHLSDAFDMSRFFMGTAELITPYRAA